MDRIRPFAAGAGYYRDPALFPPPVGRKLFLYTATGTAVVGTWGPGCLGWAPLLQPTPEMKAAVGSGAYLDELVLFEKRSKAGLEVPMSVEPEFVTWRVPRVEIKYLDHRLNLNGEWRMGYATDGSAGLDVRACLHEPRQLWPGRRELIPLGFALHLGDPGFAALLLPRSGKGHEKGLVLGDLVGLVDSDYQGQVYASAWNNREDGTPPLLIRPGDAIAQLVIVPVLRPVFQNVREFSVVTGRGESGFWHSDGSGAP